jgi:hypothetical protein
MSQQYPRERIRLAVQVTAPSEVEEITDKITGQSPDFWRGTDLQFELGFFWDADSLKELDISNFATIRLDIRDPINRRGPAIISETIGQVDMDPAMTAETWADDTRQHAKIVVSKAKTFIDMLGKNERDLLLVLSVVMISGDEDVLGVCGIRVSEAGLNSTLTTPVFGANIVPPGAVYDGGGHYTLNGLVASTSYDWAKGANDTQMANGAEVQTASGRFTATGTSVIFTGSPGQLVTASVRGSVFATYDEVRGLLAGVLRVMNAKGVVISTKSANEAWVRTIGVDDDGSRIDQVLPTT